MPTWMMPDWGAMFRLEHALPEIVLRGTITYLAIVVLMRTFLKRQAGSFGLGDMLLVVLIADASQNAMAGDYRSIPDGLVLVGTLMFWNFVLDAASYRWKWVRALIEPPSRCLVRDGRLLRKNLEREQISEEELLSQIRLKGYESLAQIREARMESEGQISVLPWPASAAGGASSGSAATEHETASP
jgi:uncharacterized membrane protein YcaP (DUF421 family)